MSRPRDQIVKWLGKVDIGGQRVLDAGCGPPSRWARNWTRREPAEYVTLDVDPAFGADLQVDINTERWASVRRRGRDDPIPCFDVAFCLEALEHCWNPVAAVGFLCDALLPGAACYISVPFINPIHDRWDYLRFTGEWFHEVLPRVGFCDVEVIPRVATAGNKHLQAFYREEGLRMSRIRYEAGDGHKIRDVAYSVRAIKG